MCIGTRRESPNSLRRRRAWVIRGAWVSPGRTGDSWAVRERAGPARLTKPAPPLAPPEALLKSDVFQMEFGASAEPRHTLAELPFRLHIAGGSRDASCFSDLLAKGLPSGLAFCMVSASVNSGGQIALRMGVALSRSSQNEQESGVVLIRCRPAGIGHVDAVPQNEHFPRPLFIVYSSINSRPAQSHL